MGVSTTTPFCGVFIEYSWGIHGVYVCVGNV